MEKPVTVFDRSIDCDAGYQAEHTCAEQFLRTASLKLLRLPFLAPVWRESRFLAPAVRPLC
jgi:hypothetical protein